MKKRITRKQLKENYGKKIISIPYCSLKLLNKYEPTYFWATGLGWRADIYIFGDVAITTGYQPMGKEISRNLCNAYNNPDKNIYEFIEKALDF